uniref:Ig-like domain-containing protein n=1 Tax=Stegastes partitus TaxID=144197 RepID=A0A3B5AUX0_9TELE
MSDLWLVDFIKQGRFRNVFYHKRTAKLTAFRSFKLSVGSSSAQENITAELGQDVILPCGGPNNNDSFIAAEWVRPDQQPDYVLFYRDGKCHPQFQHPLFKNRTDLQDKQMKDGDVSLVLNDVKMEDTGTYVCRVFLKETIDRQSAIVKIVHLEVHPPGEFVSRAHVISWDRAHFVSFFFVCLFLHF